MRAIAAEGRIEREIRRLGYRGSIIIRVGGTACASILGLVFGAADTVASTAVVVAVNAWGIGYLVRLSRTDHGSWPRAVDAGLVAVLCLTQRWTVRPEVLQGITNWVAVAVALTVLAYQWQGGARHRVIATAAVTAAYLVGSVLAGVPSLIYTSIGFGLVLSAALSWALYRLVVAGAREADRLVAGRERARRDAEVAAARRADELEQLAALHDGAMATMLAVGMGVVTGREAWLSAQAARDLEALTGDRVAAHGEVDLGRLLGEVARDVPVGVESRLPGAMHIPASAAVAICQAAREALVNVARHAGVDVASLLLERRAGMVVVEVADDGRGFHPARISPFRHGISLSIVDRMVGIGGRATVLSHPGGGTQVRLEWPHG